MILASCREHKKDCTAFRTGTFGSMAMNNGGNSAIISREEATQAEVVIFNGVGMTNQYKVAWRSDCDYTLFYVSTDNPLYKTLKPGDSMTVNILETFGDSAYSYKSSYNNIISYDTFFRIKKEAIPVKPLRVDAAQAEADSIISRISSSEKIKDMNKRLASKSEGKLHLSFLISKTPTTEDDVYWIQAGVNGEDRFETLLNFEVDNKTKAILYHDVINDTKVPFAEWEKAKED